MPPGGHLITRSSIAEINFPVVESMVFGETTPLRTARAGSEPVLSASRLSAPFRWAGGEAVKGGPQRSDDPCGRGQGGARKRHLEYKS